MATNTTSKISTLYSDFRINFDNHPITEDLLVQTNTDAVIRSIKNILFTQPFERYGMPAFGAGLIAYLFEPISRMTEETIRQAIVNSLRTYEKRAEIIEVYVSADPDNNAYNAKIVFALINIQEPITFTFLLNRIR